jgi:hypothetical protein
MAKQPYRMLNVLPSDVDASCWAGPSLLDPVCVVRGLICRCRGVTILTPDDWEYYGVLIDMTGTRSLAFAPTPDYDKARRMLRKIMNKVSAARIALARAAIEPAT